MRALILAAAVAAFAFAPISAAVAGPLKGLPPVQTVGVKVPLKLIQVSTGGYDDPGEPAEDVDCTCTDPAEEWPGNSGGTDEPDTGDDEWLDPPYPPPGDEPDDPSTDP